MVQNFDVPKAQSQMPQTQSARQQVPLAQPKVGTLSEIELMQIKQRFPPLEQVAGEIGAI